MSVSTATAATRRPPVHDDQDDDAADADARREVGAAFDSILASAGDVGERMPDLIRTVRAGATDAARTIQAWPEPTQRLLAAFSLGLGVGLMVSGAPRVLVGGALLPALGVAASVLGSEADGGRRPA